VACEAGQDQIEGDVVNVAIILIILALILGGVGLFVEALRWVLIIAVVLLVWGAISSRGARA
jgi:ABC-type multidrug transport system permease subunit